MWKEEKEGSRKVFADQLVLKGDLERFKNELLDAIQNIVEKSSKPKVKKWMKSVEVKKLLGVSHGKLQTMRNSGIITFMKIGGSIYYDEDDIVKMFEKNKVTDGR